MPDSFQVLNEIRKSYRMVGEPLSLTFIHERLKQRFKISSKQVGNFLKELHKSYRIEFIGDRVKPIGENNRSEIPFKDNDIKDTLFDMKRATPDESRIYFEDKYSVRVNASTWNRRVRQMFAEGKLHRQGKYYSLKKEYEQRRLVV